MGLANPSSRGSAGSASVKLLRAASDLVGGDDRLAQRLNISRLLLARYMAGKDELPPQIMLRTVDLLLEERESQFALPGEAPLSAEGSSDGPAGMPK